jgi:type I restriction enzyme M protein
MNREKLQVLWHSGNILRGELEVNDQINLQVISLVHLYIESNEKLLSKLDRENQWSVITSSGYGLRERLEQSLKALERAFPFLVHVFEYIDIPKQLSEATIFAFVSHLKKELRVKESEFGPLMEELLYFYVDVAGRNGGEFASPKSITKLLPKLLNIKDGEVYDGAAGVTQLLIDCHHQAIQHHGKVKLLGQEKNSKTWALGKTHLFLWGLTDSELVLGDTLVNPLLKQEHALRKFDYVVMTPPFSLSKWGQSKIKDEMLGRFTYGLPSDTNADMAFISHAIASLNDNGKAAVVVPHGVLFRGGADAKIRQELLRADLIEAVIGLPPNLFSNAGIPVVVLLFNKNKSTERKGKVLFLDASKEYNAQRGQNFLEDEQLNKIVATYANMSEQKQYSYLASIEEIADADWILTIPRYVSVSEVATEFGTVHVDLPRFENAGVVLKRLDEVSETFRGYNIPSISKVTDPNGKYHVIQLVDVQDGQLITEQLQTVTINGGGSKLKKYLVQEGDIIISNRGSSTKMAFVPPFEGKLLLTQNFHAIRPNPEVDTLYLKAYLESPVAQAYIQPMQQGTVVKVLGLKELNNLMVPLQPLEVQQKIGEGIQSAEASYRQALIEANKQKKESYQKWYEEMGINTAISKD